jgi:two-component system cell cycle sensor histidine kinase/response regulator CckA
VKTDFYQMENQMGGAPYNIERIPGINIIGDIGAGVAVVSLEGRVITANPALLMMLGYSEPEILKVEFFQLIESDDLIGEPGFVKKGGILEKGERYQADKRLLRKDGCTFWARLTVSRREQEALSIDYLVVTVEDITQWKQTEEALIGEKKRAELLKSQKFESIGLLARGIAHDFNNILAGILANVQLAKLSYEKGRDITKNLAGTENAVKRAADLTKQLFGFSKDEPLVKELTSIDQIIKETVEFSLHDSKAKCEYSFPENLWPIDVDPGQLSQVIDHLIMNADQSMPQGGVIRVSARNIQIHDKEVPALTPGAYVQINIRDAGIGIPEANLGKIFDPFFTTKERRSGLGLTNSYSIVKRHDGHINVTSTVGMGTTIEIYLPVTLNHSPTVVEQVEYQAVNG